MQALLKNNKTISFESKSSVYKSNASTSPLYQTRERCVALEWPEKFRYQNIN